jgi:hypothetical protein
MALLRYFRRSTDPLREAEVAQTPASSMAVTSFVRLLLDRTANSPVLDDRLRGSPPPMPVLALGPKGPDPVEAAHACGFAAFACDGRKHLGRPRRRNVVVLRVEDRVAADLTGRVIKHGARRGVARQERGPCATLAALLRDGSERAALSILRCGGTHVALASPAERPEICCRRRSQPQTRRMRS